MIPRRRESEIIDTHLDDLQSEMEAGSRLDGLSLVMKGETLPAESRWRGIPARAMEE